MARAFKCPDTSQSSHAKGSDDTCQGAPLPKARPVQPTPDQDDDSDDAEAWGTWGKVPRRDVQQVQDQTWIQDANGKWLVMDMMDDDQGENMDTAENDDEAGQGNNDDDMESVTVQSSNVSGPIDYVEGDVVTLLSCT